MRAQQVKIAYSGDFVQVKEAFIDGYKWEMAYLPDSLAVFPITEQNELIMIEEKRPHERTPSRLKFVTGHLHEDDEDVLATANREMMEEIGFRANKLAEFMKHVSTGTINSTFHFVIAKDLEPKKIPNPDGEDTILAIHKVPLDQIEEMLYADKLNWTLTALGLFKLIRALKEEGLESLFKAESR